MSLIDEEDYYLAEDKETGRVEIIQLDNDGYDIWLMGTEVPAHNHDRYKILRKIHFKPTILIWKFEDAPKEYQDLSENYGDEDWIAFVPEVFAKEYIGFLDSGTRFGNFTEEHDVEGGIIVIGCHA